MSQNHCGEISWANITDSKIIVPAIKRKYSLIVMLILLYKVIIILDLSNLVVNNIHQYDILTIRKANFRHKKRAEALLNKTGKIIFLEFLFSFLVIDDRLLTFYQSLESLLMMFRGI